MIETAKANGLDPYLYLEYLFSKLPGKDIKRDPKILDSLLPWNEKIKEHCKKGNSRQIGDVYSDNLFHSQND